jgi:hypothetical protein
MSHKSSAARSLRSSTRYSPYSHSASPTSAYPSPSPYSSLSTSHHGASLPFETYLSPTPPHYIHPSASSIYLHPTMRSGNGHPPLHPSPTLPPLDAPQPLSSIHRDQPSAASHQLRDPIYSDFLVHQRSRWPTLEPASTPQGPIVSISYASGLALEIDISTVDSTILTNFLSLPTFLLRILAVLRLVIT